MKKLLRYATLLTLFVVMLFGTTGCFGAMNLPVNYSGPTDGSVFAINARTLMYGLQQAMLDKPGTTIWVKDTYCVVMWGDKYGTMFFTFDSASKTVTDLKTAVSQGGDLVNIKTAEDLINTLKNTGFKVVTASGAPEVLKQLVRDPKITPFAVAPEGFTTFIFAIIGPATICAGDIVTPFQQLYCGVPDNKS